MKSMIVYSSKTGNTRMVAKAIQAVFPHGTEVYSVEDAPDPDFYDFLALGFWVDKGSADPKARGYFKRVKGKKIALFGTLGAYPDSDHATQCLERVRELNHANEILGEFLCQGRVDPDLVRMMETKMKDDPHHSMTPERKKRLAEAEKHPDEADLTAARIYFRDLLAGTES